MKVNFFRSVGAKLFLYMTVMVLITVAGTSYQYIRTFLHHQTKQVQDTVQMQAEKAGSRFENIIEGWRAQVAVALPTLRGARSQDTSRLIKNFVDSNPEFISFRMFQAPGPSTIDLKQIGGAFTSNTADPRFEDKVPEKIQQKLLRLNRRVLRNRIPRLSKGDKAVIETITGPLDLPVMMMAIRFSVEKSKKVVWAVLNVWQSDLIKGMPKSQYLSSVVIDEKGKVFTSPNIHEMVSRESYFATPLARRALSGKAPSGFVNEYNGVEGKRKLGAFSLLPQYDLAVLVEKDSEAAYSTLKRNLISTGLWALLFLLLAVMFSFLGAAGITRGLRAVAYATGRIASGDFNYRIQPKSQDEVGVLSVSVNQMSQRIVHLLHAQVEKARFEKELDTAKTVQSTLFPKQDINLNSLKVSGFYQPASECGGDLWGHYSLDDGVEFLFVADAMGHGAPAALVTAMAYSTCVTIGDMVKGRPELQDTPAEILNRLNRVIYDAVRGQISMTFFGAILDLNRGTMTYANAGHNFPLLLPQSKDDPRAGRIPKSLRKISDIPAVSLKLKGTPLGMEPGSTYEEKTVDLKAGDKFFLFTDGLIECTSPNGAAWGRKYLLEQVVDTAKLNPEKMKNEILDRAFKFFADQPPDDDITVVVAEVPKTWAPKTGPESENVVEADFSTPPASDSADVPPLAASSREAEEAGDETPPEPGPTPTHAPDSQEPAMVPPPPPVAPQRGPEETPDLTLGWNQTPGEEETGETATGHLSRQESSWEVSEPWEAGGMEAPSDEERPGRVDRLDNRGATEPDDTGESGDNQVVPPPPSWDITAPAGSNEPPFPEFNADAASTDEAAPGSDSVPSNPFAQQQNPFTAANDSEWSAFGDSEPSADQGDSAEIERADPPDATGVSFDVAIPGLEGDATGGGDSESWSIQDQGEGGTNSPDEAPTVEEVRQTGPQKPTNRPKKKYKITLPSAS